MQRTTGRGGVMATPLRPTRDAAFESWLVAREPALQRTAHLLTGDVHTAQDLVQNTLAKLYLSWDRLRGIENADAYARRILLNEHRTAWRRPVRRREQVVGEVPDRPAPDQPEYDGRREAVWRFVCSLPPKQRAVVVLRFYEQLTEPEIADLMGISLGTVKSQSSRALAALRAQLPDRPEITGEDP
ncbi:MAG: SigE family RNA polymerase sigma factor [Nocardioidaceae bacterium]